MNDSRLFSYLDDGEFEVWGVRSWRFDTVPVLFCVESWTGRRDVEEQG
jgi:hypothetical protein